MSIYSTISANIWKSYVIMVLFIVFAGTVGYVLGRAMGDAPTIGISIFVFSILYSGISYFYSDKIVLATSQAKQIKKTDNPELFRIVENLAIGDGIPMPKVYVMEDAAPNAFATGRDPQHASIAVTTGILERLKRVELEGVLAHELSHIKNYDTRLLAITAVLVGFIALISDIFMRNLWWSSVSRDNRRNNQGQAFFIIIGIVLAIIAPLIASLIQLAVSRKREFLADASGVLLTRYPEGLASALEKISNDPHQLRAASTATAPLFIINPFKKKSFDNMLTNFFSTHPPITERIKILRAM